MQSRITFQHSVRWLGVCLTSTLLTVAALSMAQNGYDSVPTVNMFEGAGNDARENVNVYISFEKVIAVKELSAGDLILERESPDGIASASKEYCLHMNFDGDVTLKISGENSAQGTFQLKHLDSQDKVPLTVKVTDNISKKNVQIEPDQENSIKAYVPSDGKQICDTSTTTLHVETDTQSMVRSGRYQTSLNLRFTAM